MSLITFLQILICGGFPGGSEVENPPASAGDTGDVSSIPGSGRSPGGGNGSPSQYPRLEHPMDRGAWWATGRGVCERLSVYRAGRHTPGLRIIKGSGRQTPLMGIFQASSSYFPRQIIKAGQVSPKGRHTSYFPSRARRRGIKEQGSGRPRDLRSFLGKQRGEPLSTHCQGLPSWAHPLVRAKPPVSAGPVEVQGSTRSCSRRRLEKDQGEQTPHSAGSHSPRARMRGQ